MHIIGNVIAGTYLNATIGISIRYNLIELREESKVDTGKTHQINKETVVSCQLISADDTTTHSYSYWKGLLGASLLGPLGLIAGAGGKKTGCKKWLIEIVWKNGQKSLIEIYDEKGYKFFLQIMY